nr:MFS transporter [Lachnospiraceae bacterium]
VSVVAAHLFASAGLVGMAFLPDLLPSAYLGLLRGGVLYAVGGGIIEVLISPIVEACPTEKKEAAMSLLHSFYCWGHVAVVLGSTLFFQVCGIQNWKLLACLWAILPVMNAVYFCVVPIYPIAGGHADMSVKGLFSQKVFWILLFLMIGAGASEQGMSQWASTFAESALGVTKLVGDLAGPCAFAIFMGTSRALYGKYSDRIPLKKMMIGSAVLCVACYLTAALSTSPVIGLIGCAVCGFSVGIFWPGTFSLAAAKLPTAGTAMYAFMALAGDVGCSLGPTVVGMAANVLQGDLKSGLLAALVFPAVILAGIVLLGDRSAKRTK